MGEILLVVALGAGFLHAFYRAVEFQWPASYFTIATRLGYTITATPLRYVTFRFAPVWLTCLFAAVTLSRVHESAAIGVVGIAMIHVLTTSGRAIWSLARGHEAREKGPLVALHVGVALGVVVAAASALLLRSSLASLVPPVAELSASLWTALLAGVVGVYILHLSRARTTDLDAAFKRSRSTIPTKLWRQARAVAIEGRCDATLVRAIMLVENMQRPRWWRHLERIKAVFVHPGTYGIMQVRADKPISDEESLRRCVAERLAGVQIPPDEHGYPDYDALRAAALAYNPDDEFATAITSAYSYVQNTQERGRQ